eukprot:NODE_8562_length_1486_cov_2.926416.p1 GENE.NODE_8562_length_1486_cov_2.926416~~NODE_8562_length_1486_cov_2.926416.p1  ORF type:complete len:339 (-),score=80.40 NODE_8562_length_1486_cov_2.926416:345-1361(-)
MDGGDGMDALFGSFMNEVTSLKSNKMKKLERSAGTPEAVVERLTSKTFDSAFQVLQLSPEASESEITKKYRKLSVLVHPDKCKLEGAAEAFQVLSKAYHDTKDPSYKDKYKDVVGEARKRVRERIEKENKERERKREDPLDTQGHDFDQEVLQECERLTTVVTEAATYQSKVLEANMKWQAEQAKLAKEAWWHARAAKTSAHEQTLTAQRRMRDVARRQTARNGRRRATSASRAGRSSSRTWRIRGSRCRRGRRWARLAPPTRTTTARSGRIRTRNLKARASRLASTSPTRQRGAECSRQPRGEGGGDGVVYSLALHTAARGKVKDCRLRVSTRWRWH